VLDLREVGRRLFRAEVAVRGPGVFGHDAVDLGDLGLAADEEHLGRESLGIDGDRDVGVRAQRAHPVRDVADVRRRDERRQHQFRARPFEPARQDARGAIQCGVCVAGRDRRSEQPPGEIALQQPEVALLDRHAAKVAE
jgi:hypothetical protein